jgi:hypothetical protein
MTVPAARVLAFPGIDLEALTKLRARACDAFMRNDMSAFQEACTVMRRLIGRQGVADQQVVPEIPARTYHDRGREGRRQAPLQETPSQEARDRPNADSMSELPSAAAWEWAADVNHSSNRSRPA